MASVVRLAVFSLLLLFLAPSALAHSPKQQAAMPQPFTRQLSLQTPFMNGSDVLILQWLVNRSPFVQGNITKDGNYGTQTAGAVKAFQAGNNMYVALPDLLIRRVVKWSPFADPLLCLAREYRVRLPTARLRSATGIFDVPTANLLLALHSYDGYKDDGTILPGFLYKVYVPVSQNRSVEPLASLYDSSLNLLMQFRVRLHGQDDANGNALNQFSSSGSTPTGCALSAVCQPYHSRGLG